MISYICSLCVCVFVCDCSCVLFSFKLEGDTRGWLEIDAATGEIKTIEKLDRETLETFEVTVTAFEKGEMRESAYLRGFCVIDRATGFLNYFYVTTISWFCALYLKSQMVQKWIQLLFF